MFVFILRFKPKYICITDFTILQTDTFKEEAKFRFINLLVLGKSDINVSVGQLDSIDNLAVFAQLSQYKNLNNSISQMVI